MHLYFDVTVYSALTPYMATTVHVYHQECRKGRNVEHQIDENSVGPMKYLVGSKWFYLIWKAL